MQRDVANQNNFIAAGKCSELIGYNTLHLFVTIDPFLIFFVLILVRKQSHRNNWSLKLLYMYNMLFIVIEKFVQNLHKCVI